MKTRRRLTALLMALVMVLSLVPAINAAVLPTIPNIAIDANNVVTWDAVDGAADYDWTVSNGGGILKADKPLTIDLNDRLAAYGFDSGEYTFSIYARDEARNRVSETWTVTFTYTSKGKLATPTNPVWDGTVAKWDAVENAMEYTVFLYKEGRNSDSKRAYVRAPATQYDFSEGFTPEEGVKYEFTVQARPSYNGSYNGYSDSDYSARSAAKELFVPKSDIANVKITDGVLTWDAYDGATVYYWGCGTFGGYHYPAEGLSIDLKAECAYYDKASGTYNVSLVALNKRRDEGGKEISNKWTGTYDYKKAAPYTVTFSAESGKGSGTMAAVEGLAADASYTLPECGFTVADGLTFTGWNVTIGTADTVKKQPGETITVSDDVLLEAVIEDTRTVVKTFVATSDFVAPEYGDAMTDPSRDYTYTFTQGAEGHLLRYSSSASWLKWDETEGEWYNCDDEPAFTEGKYKIHTQLRIDDNAGLTHKLPADYSEISLTVDGQAWEVDDYIFMDPTFSFVWVFSPEIVVEWKALPLTFTDSDTFNIGNTSSNRLYKDKAITSFTVKNAVSGGVQPYTFSKVSGPEWLNVAADGTVSGTPTALGANDALVVRVTDSNDPAESKEISIYVGDAYLDPADREVVKTFVATSDFVEPEYGDAVTRPSYDYTYTFTQGAEGGLLRYSSSAGWDKWNEVQSDWNEYEEASFTEGIYRISTQLRIDDDNGMLYRLPDDFSEISLTVDGQAWTVGDGWVDTTYSMVWVYSPSYLVTKPVGELVFMDNAAFDIGENYGNTAITAFSVASAVSGGTEPYTFSKVSGPAWLNVAADGTVSGTPTEAGYNEDLVVRVTDSTDPVKTKEITIDVGRTWPNPADREKVTSITATSDIYTPLYGEDVEPVEFEMAGGSKARFAGGSMRGWYKQDGENWVQYTGAKFVAGTYRYENTVIIDGENGHLYQLAEPFTATVDGKAWTLKSLDVKSAQSTAIIYSPSVTVVAPNMIDAATVTFDSNQLNAGCSRILVLTVGDSAKYSATIEKWYKGGTPAAPGANVGTGGTFEGGNTYVLELALTPAAGNVFAAGAPLTVNGQSAQYVEAIGDTLIFRVAFDIAEPAPVGGDVIRLAGRNRFETAFLSADALKEVQGVEKFPAAIVTSGMNFADALAGSYLAAVTGAPILLTDNDNMADVIAYIEANVEAGGTVYALGGTAVVADTLKAVENSGFVFKRLAGSNRFATNLMILEEAGINSGDPVLVCTAYNFADSLSASALGLPILLVDDTVSAAQMDFLRENADGEFILVGGTGAVKPAVEEQLREYWDVVRLAGNNRFQTSVLTAIDAFGYSADSAVLAYGYNFPDGLCAGPLAYALGAPLILTATGDEAAAVEYATAAGITSGFVLGGPTLIDDPVVKSIFSMGAGDSIVTP